MADTAAYTAPERFAVSHLGMREIHGDRPPWQLVKELIQNVFDEAPAATECRVTLSLSPTEPESMLLEVEDDGPGFADIADAWTLLKPTPKRMDPAKRGRFNLGEKEVLSVALEARVETAGHTVDFPRIGSRVHTENGRDRGTRLTALMPWTAAQKIELEERLRRFRPTDCRLFVNGVEVPPREPVKTWAANLPTVLQAGPGEPLRRTNRNTTLHFLAPDEEYETGWLYEMGIPIQPIACQWDIDIQQKVPMPPNRDTVGEAYLQDIYAEALNAFQQDLEPEQFGAAWIDTAIEDSRVQQTAVRRLVKGRYGERPIFTGPDRDANLHAAEAGHSLIHPNSLSAVERQRFKQDAQVPTARELYGRSVSFDPTNPNIILSDRDNPAFETFREWVIKVASYCGLVPEVVFYQHEDRVLASCTGNTTTPRVSFNCANLAEDFFRPPYNRAEQLDVVIHELGHALANKPMEHGPAWGHGCSAAGSLIAAGLLRAAQGGRTPLRSLREKTEQGPPATTEETPATAAAAAALPEPAPPPAPPETPARAEGNGKPKPALTLPGLAAAQPPPEPAAASARPY